MRSTKIYGFILPFFTFLISCDNSPVSSGPGDSSFVPNITIQSNARIYWYFDSLFEQNIYPSTVRCTPGVPCLIVSTGAWDYTCTVFPDTFWGIIEYDILPPETLICMSDSAWVLNDTTVYSMSSYFQKQANALCSESAKAYTHIGMCYQLSSSETSVRVRNSCFDTTFSDCLSFCLPKLPLDSQYGVWFESVDTFFCPFELINGYDDYLTRQFIKSWSQ